MAKNYIVVSHTNKEAFERLCGEKLAQGAEPIGGIAIAYHPDHNTPGYAQGFLLQTTPAYSSELTLTTVEGESK